jgi:hypothetical protein
MVFIHEGTVKDWKDRAGEFDLAGKPLTRALVTKAPQDIEAIERDYGFALEFGDSLESMVDMAVIADVLCLLLGPLAEVQELDKTNGVFPKDRVLTFVCAVWFFTAVIPRLEEEGNSMDITRLSGKIGMVLFAPYGDENVTGLVKIGVQYWKELGVHAPAAIIEWHRSFAQMIFIHYELLTNTAIDLGGLDLDMTIEKMVTVFLSMTLSLPEMN